MLIVMSDTFEADRFSDSFAAAQEALGGRIEVVDRSDLVVAQPDAARDLLMAGTPNRQGFYELQVSGQELRGNPVFRHLLGRVVLMPNRQLHALSPAIITAGEQQDYTVTMLNQPFVPDVGFTPGQHFGLSVKAQTRTAGFGGHGVAGGYEAGHFSTVLVGSRERSVGQAIVRAGDLATHQVISAGVPEAMSQTDMLAVPYRSARVPANSQAKMAIFWHPALDDERGPAAGDYPDAIRLMLGAGVAAIGQRGLDDAQRLVEHATKGMA